MPVTRTERWTIGSITAAFTLLLVVWALLTPLFQAPDELPHTGAVVAIATGEGWPAPGALRVSNALLAARAEVATTAPADRGTWAELVRAAPGASAGADQMTQHPPTAYALAAVVLRMVGFEDLRWDHVIVVLRLLDVALVAPLPMLVWAAGRRLTRSRRFGVVAAAALAAVPQLAQIGSSVTNDALVILLGAVVTWLAVQVATGDLRWRTTVALGAALGVLVATKATGFPAVPLVGLAFVVATTARLRVRLGRAAVALAIGAALGAGGGSATSCATAPSSRTGSPAPGRRRRGPRASSATRGSSCRASGPRSRRRSGVGSDSSRTRSTPSWWWR